MSQGTPLFLLILMFLPIAVGRVAYVLVEGGIERLTVGKPYHGADFLDILRGISLVGEHVHRFAYSILIQQTGIVHAEAGVDHRREIACVGLQFSGQFFGREVGISVTLLNHYDVQNLIIQFIGQFRTDQ